MKLRENNFGLKIHTVTKFGLSNTIGTWFTSLGPFALGWSRDFKIRANISNVWESDNPKNVSTFNSYFNFDPCPILAYTRICTLLDPFLGNDDTIGYRVWNIYKICKQLSKSCKFQKQLVISQFLWLLILVNSYWLICNAQVWVIACHGNFKEGTFDLIMFLCAELSIELSITNNQ